MTLDLQGVLNKLFDESNRALRVTLESAAGAMTQTYATADATLGTPTAAATATTGATLVTPAGYTTTAQADAIVTNLNALRNDVLDLAQFVNALVDKLQSVGLIT